MKDLYDDETSASQGAYCFFGIALGVGLITWLTETLALIVHTDTFKLEWAICMPLSLYLITPCLIVGGAWRFASSQERRGLLAKRSLSAYTLLVALFGLMIWTHDEATILGQVWRLRLSFIMALFACIGTAFISVKMSLKREVSEWTFLKVGVVLWGLTMTTVRIPRALVLDLFNHRWGEMVWGVFDGLVALAWAWASWWALSALTRSMKPIPLIFRGMALIAICFLSASACLYGPLSAPKPFQEGGQEGASTVTSVSERDVFVFILDSLRADHASAELMPSLEALKEEGVSFERASSPSIMTEVSLPRLLGATNPLHLPSLPERLRAEGLAIHLVSDYPNTSLSGLDRYRWSSIARPHPWRRYLLTSLTRYLSAFLKGDSYQIGGVRSEKHPFEEPEEGWGGVVTHFKETLQSAEGAGFYLTHLATPHSPYNLPPYRAQSLKGPSLEETWAMNERFRLERGEGKEVDIAGRKLLYRLAVRAADETLGALLKEVRAHKARTQREALIIVTSDHGEPFGEHGAVGHGRSLYEEAHHVPLVLSGEGFAGGKRSSALVSGAQLPPTIESWLNLSPTPRLTKRPLSLKPIEEREVLVWFPRGSVLTQGRWRLIFTEKEHLLTRPKSWGHRAHLELFNLERDPAERENLALKEPAQVQRLLKVLIKAPETPESTRRAALKLLSPTPSKSPTPPTSSKP